MRATETITRRVTYSESVFLSPSQEQGFHNQLARSATVGGARLFVHNLVARIVGDTPTHLFGKAIELNLKRNINLGGWW